METIRYPVPQPVPPLAVRRLVPGEAAQIAALYRAAGRDGAWCAEENTVRALLDMGAVWWGGFAGGDLALCAACAASTADTPQAAALRGALASGAGNPGPEPERFLLPPAASRQGEVLAGPLLLLLAEQLFSFAAAASQLQKDESLLQNSPETAAHWPVARWPRGAETAPAAFRQREAETAPAAFRQREAETAPAASRQREAEPAQALLAALPVKAPAPMLAAYFAAGFAAVRMRPLVSLRPHYLLVWRDILQRTNEQELPQTNAGSEAVQENAKNRVLVQKIENSTWQASMENGTPKYEPDALRRVYLPLADTLAVSRLLEQGFCASALCRSSADERMLIQLERESG